MNPSGPGLLFSVKFLITKSVSLLKIGLLIFLISSWFNFGGLYVFRNLSIYSRLSNLVMCNFL